MHSLDVPRAPAAPSGLTLADVLHLERSGSVTFRSTATYDYTWRLYGGQVMAQALLAAGGTVAPDRTPHSVHAYFLAGGSSKEPVEFTVEVDREGRSFSARRVCARQRGELLLTVSASFTVAQERPAEESPVLVMPDIEPPGAPQTPPVLVEFVQSVPSQPHPMYAYPTRYWVRCEAERTDDALLDCAAVVYLSDLGTGHDALASSARHSQATLDHAVWFHRRPRPHDWLLVDLSTRGVSAGRGLYTGEIWSADGTLVASMAQESLYREGRA